MGKYDVDHAMYAAALRRANQTGRLAVPCGRSRTDALALRTRFYTFFKYLERQEDDAEAKELLAIRQNLTIGAYKNGELVLEKRSLAQPLEYLGQALAAEDERTRVSQHGMLGELLEDDSVEIKIEADRIRERQEMKERWANRKPIVLTDEDREELDRRTAGNSTFI